MARSQPLFKKKRKEKRNEKKIKKERKEKYKRKLHHSFLVSGPSQRSLVFTTGCHLSPTSLLSPPGESVSLHHRPLFSIFKLNLPEFSTLSLRGDVRIYSEDILNIILLIYIS
jgi:hypothetical protein